MKACVDAIVVGERDRQDMGDVAALAASIGEVGLLHPVVVMPKGATGFELVAGGRRLEAVKHLGWSEVPVTVVDFDTVEAVLRAEADENTQRKPLTPTEALAARDRRARVLAPLAEARAEEGRHRGGVARQGGQVGSKLDQTSETARKTRKLAAVGTGYSGSTLDKVAKIRDAAEAETVRHGGREVPVPEPVRETARAALADVSRTGAAVERAHRQVQGALDRHVPVSREQRASKWQANFLTACRSVYGVTAFPVDDVVELGDMDCLRGLEAAAESLAAYAAKVRAAGGLRVVQGGGQR